jgi:hypothetical protein
MLSRTILAKPTTNHFRFMTLTGRKIQVCPLRGGGEEDPDDPPLEPLEDEDSSG